MKRTNQEPQSTWRAGKSWRGEEGMALLITMLALFMIALTGMVIARIAATEIELTGHYRSASQAFFAADGGAEYGLNELLTMGRSMSSHPTSGDLSSITVPPLSDSNFTTFTIVPTGALTLAPLTSGYFQGLTASTQDYLVMATAETVAVPIGTSTVTMKAAFDIIPIFQFAIFYEEDLELLPGPNMWLSGRVHSNQSIYIDCGNTLTVDAVMTAAGDIFNFRKNNGGTSAGDVEIRDSNGNFQGMSGLDSSSPTWHDDALDRWHGNVRSSDHGIERLNMTIDDPTNPRMIIEPGLSTDTQAQQDGKMYYEADLRIINGKAYNNNGNIVSVIDPNTGTSAIEQTDFWDPREQRFILATKIDMAKLGRSPGWPNNGIIYAGGFMPGVDFADWDNPPPWSGGGYTPPWSNGGQLSHFGIMLHNGSELAAAATVVSANPIYLQGNYNNVNKVGAAVIADAITILSNRWGDVNGDGDTTDGGDGDLAYSQLSMNGRNAWSTTVNAALMLGNTDTVPGVVYNGGVENVLRFIERWSGDTLTYLGSIVDLWNSEIAVGAWGYGNPIYTAPIRNWGFDTDFLDPANLPPGTPNVYMIRVLGWDRSQ
ncbi:MAG: hypothetical protein IH849_00615 [Acidobacteria bacterium]|nr:hypothetical protein [Acidobacteriota bacterium]